MAAPRLSSDERHELLVVARSSLEAAVRRHVAPEPVCRGALAQPSGAFVTLTRHGLLRGCLGHIEPHAALALAVAALARAVADADPRFPPVEASELAHIGIELSVLATPREIRTADDIDLGRHGLVVEQGARRGLLLPKVAVEHGWTRTALLEHTCRKAGLAPDAWSRGARLLVFEAEVFAEGDADAVSPRRS
jgi:AmmeMemoRadiSam system protein A